MKRVHVYEVRKNYSSVRIEENIYYADSLYNLIERLGKYVEKEYPEDIKVNDYYDFGDFTVRKVEE